MSLFRYGLDYVQMAIQRLIGFGKKEEFKEILAILRKQNPDRIRVLWNLSCTEKNLYKNLKMSTFWKDIDHDNACNHHT